MKPANDNAALNATERIIRSRRNMMDKAGGVPDYNAQARVEKI